MSTATEEGLQGESPQFEGLLGWFIDNVDLLRPIEKRSTARDSLLSDRHLRSSLNSPLADTGREVTQHMRR